MKTDEKLMVLLVMVVGLALTVYGDIFGNVIVGISLGYFIARVEG